MILCGGNFQESGIELQIGKFYSYLWIYALVVKYFVLEISIIA